MNNLRLLAQKQESGSVEFIHSGNRYKITIMNGNMIVYRNNSNVGMIYIDDNTIFPLGGKRANRYTLEMFTNPSFRKNSIFEKWEEAIDNK